MNEKTIHPFGDIVVRIPRLPLQVAEDLLNGDISEEKIKSYLLDKDVLEAIGSASASLKISLEKWLNGHTLPEKKQTSLLFKSMQYLIRMSSRPTPFGLMAGLTSGSWSDENVIELNGKERIASRPDMQFCRYLAGVLESSEDGEKLKFFPNSSIYRVFEELRYFRSGKSGKTTKLHSIEDPGILEKLAEYCRRGKTKAEIRQFWDSCRESTFFPEDFQDELFRLRFLVPELEPNVCGQTYYTRINGFMKQDYPASCRHPKSRHLHTNLFIDNDRCEADKTMIPEIISAIKVMLQLFPKKPSVFLQNFITSFRQNYGNRDIPLMQALDPETGIIIPAAEPFGDSAMKAGTSGIPGRQSVTLDRTDLFLLKKIQESWIKQFSTIHIRAGELPCLDDFAGLSPTFNVLFSIVEVPGNTLIHLHGIGGFSACHLLSRFGHCDPHIGNILEKITGKEKAPDDAIAAEIVFCPPGREADLCVRPELREYEIPVMTHSCKDELHKIYPADLLLCLRDGDLVLKSAKINRYIIPYASHTLNFQNYDLPLHRLLCELQTQYLGGGMLFDWGALSRLFPVLPRVMTGNTILMPASWRFNNDEIARFFSINDKEELKKSITRWRYRFRIPARVVWSGNDQELPLNLNSFAGIELFLWLSKNRQEILLKEFLMSGTHLVKGRKGYHLHEIIAPFYLEGKERK